MFKKIFRLLVKFIALFIPVRRWRKSFRNYILNPNQCYFAHRAGVKAYLFKNAMEPIVSKLKKGLDLKSKKIIDEKIDQYLNFPSKNFNVSLSDSINKLRIGHFLNNEEKKIHRQFLTDRRSYPKKYKLKSLNYTQEVFQFHHGLKDLPESVKSYIKGKDFFDIGAYIGDSALVLKDYKPKRIYSFETSESAISEYKYNMELNKIPPSKYSLEKYLLGNKNGHLHLDIHTMMIHTSSKGKVKMPIQKLDNFLKRKDINMGLVKMDVENAEMDVLKGGIGMLKKFRPVVLCTIYHSAEQFFEIKPYLEKYLPNYAFKIRNLSTVVFPKETTLIAYPKEIFKNISDKE